MNQYERIVFSKFNNIKKNLSDINVKKYEERIKYELKIFKKIKCSKITVILYKMGQYMKKNMILVTPGFGSLSSSLISYILGVTFIDPIKFNLIFERFLNYDIDNSFSPVIEMERDDLNHLVEFLVKDGAETIPIENNETFSFILKIEDINFYFKTNESLALLKDLIEKNEIDKLYTDFWSFIIDEIGENRLLELTNLNVMLDRNDLILMEKFLKPKMNLLQNQNLFIKETLSESNGILLYQEQLMMLIKGMSNFSYEEINKFRKVLGMKKLEEVKKWKEKFVKNSVNKTIANKLILLFEENIIHLKQKSHFLGKTLLDVAINYIKNKENINLKGK